MTKCNPTTSEQDIQLMCNDNNPDCNHLFQGSGAINTIVRLPDNVCFQFFFFFQFRLLICRPNSLSGFSVWPHAICARGSTPGSSTQLGYSRQWLGDPRPPIDARHRFRGGWPVTVRVFSSQDRLSTDELLATGVKSISLFRARMGKAVLTL